MAVLLTILNVVSQNYVISPMQLCNVIYSLDKLTEFYIFYVLQKDLFSRLIYVTPCHVYSIPCQKIKQVFFIYNLSSVSISFVRKNWILC